MSQRVKQILALIVILSVLAALATLGVGAGQPVIIPMIVGFVTLIQVLGWAVSALARSEKLFDACGAGTWFSAAVACCFLAPNPLSWFPLLVGGVVIAWSARLGIFLALRAARAGDNRFDEIKTDPLRFLIVWLIQAVWICGVGLGVFTALLQPAPTGWRAAIALGGVAIAAAGLAIETIADIQKQKFRARPANRGEFINTGLWARSQHPNYFGEILVWVGLAIAALTVTPAWGIILVLISPVIITVLLTRVSGIPTLDKAAAAKWGDRPDWIHYRKTTPVLIPSIR